MPWLIQDQLMTKTAVTWTSNYVNGAWVDIDEAKYFENLNPATGKVVSLVHEADEHLVDHAVYSARAALSSEWGRKSAQQRAHLLRRIADGIEARFDDLVAAEIADTGKPIQLAQTLDIKRGAMNFRVAADVIASSGQESFLTRLDNGSDALNYAVLKPLGVVAVIVPWNLPFLLLTWKVSFALACGNALVIKPSEETPSSASILAEIVEAAGLPAGVFNLVNGAADTGAILSSHPGIDGVTFTGSTSTGSKVMQAVAARVRPVSFELGGKNAAIVFDDVDLDEAADGLARSIFTNTGQVCLCTERVYIHRKIFDTLAAKLVERARNLKIGNPTDIQTTTGPLISEKHRDKVLSYFDIAVQDGAEVLVGGGVPQLGDELSGGFWVEPTLWKNLPSDSAAYREEIFGPVAALVPFDTEEEAIQMANNSEYGLASVIWTNDLRRGHRVAHQMRTGIAWVNTWFTRELKSPFGGMGLSGIGREGGASSLHFYTQPTNVCVQL